MVNKSGRYKFHNYYFIIRGKLSLIRYATWLSSMAHKNRLKSNRYHSVSKPYWKMYYKYHNKVVPEWLNPPPPDNIPGLWSFCTLLRRTLSTLSAAVLLPPAPDGLAAILLNQFWCLEILSFTFILLFLPGLSGGALVLSPPLNWRCFTAESTTEVPLSVLPPTGVDLVGLVVTREGPWKPDWTPR